MSRTNLLASNNHVRSRAVMCFRDHFVVARTPQAPNSTADLVCGVVQSGDQHGLAYADANNLNDRAIWGNMLGVPSGSPLTVNKQIIRQQRQFPSASNDVVLGPARYGWTPSRPLLGVWRSPTLSPTDMILNLSDGSSVSVPANGASSLDMIAWFDPPDCTVLPFANGWRLLTHRSSQAVYVTFGGIHGGFVQENVFLGGDATANTAFQTLSVVRGVCNAAGSQGWIVSLANTPSINPGQQLRIIYISKLTGTWCDIFLTGTDANASARIAASISESFSLIQSEFDGHFYGKANAFLNPATDQILVSPTPPQQVLPKLVPWSGLPDYGVYDKPYGVER